MGSRASLISDLCSQHISPRCNTLQHTATHSAALFGYKGPVQVSFNKLPPISASKTNECRDACRCVNWNSTACTVLWSCANIFWNVCLRARKRVWLIKKWVGMYIWMSHVTWTSSCHRQIRHVTMKESGHIWMSHVIYEWGMSHMNESRHVNVACHTWMGRVTHR